MADLGLLILFLTALCSAEAMLMSGVGGSVGSASKLDGEVQDEALLAGMASRWRMSGDLGLGWSRSDRKGRFRINPRDDGAPTSADIWRAVIVDGVLLFSDSGTAAVDGGARGYTGCKCGGKGSWVSVFGGEEGPAFLGPGPFVGGDDSLVLLDGSWNSDGIYEIGGSGGGLQIGYADGGVCGVSSTWAFWASFWSVSFICWAWVGWALSFKAGLTLSRKYLLLWRDRWNVMAHILPML